MQRPRSDIEVVSQARCFDGTQYICRHCSDVTRTAMRFAVYVPTKPAESSFPVLWFLSGLTCSEENFVQESGAQRAAAQLGLAVVAPDTSPRGENVPDDRLSYDIGVGAGFYVDATRAPWSANYQMASYVTSELPEVVARSFPIDLDRQSIMGHSMGGHGALTIALREPARFRSVSAIAPIASSIASPWGRKAMTEYLGTDTRDWRKYDACALIEDGARLQHLLVDQGLDDEFLNEQLKPDLLRSACERASMPVIWRLRPGYGHSYHYISTFIEEHLRWHYECLAEKLEAGDLAWV
jgi:S-formylglutathione hydrolase